jgi:tetratricopeptide (TPR) repeat protein
MISIWFRIIILFLAVCTANPSHVAFSPLQNAAAAGSHLTAARSLFSKGDIVGARESLQRNLSKMGASDKEEGYKLLGICSFLVGKREQAREAFEAALRINPRTRLNPKDLLDPSISDFFNGLRTTTSNPSRSQSSTRSGTASVVVQSNAPGASVFANGLFVGTPGQAIEMPAGNYQITVSASGFDPSTQTVKLGRGEQRQMQINLQDSVERRKRELLAERERRRQAEAKAAAARAVELARLKEIAAQEAARNRAASELKQLEREAAAAIARDRELERRAAEERKQQEVLALKAKALAAERDLERTRAASGKRSLADEFKDDQRPKPRPDARVAPRAGAQPESRSGNNKGPLKQASRQPPPYPGPYAYAPPVQRRRSDKSAFLAVMPFGIGQFQNENYLLGTTSALMQVGSLAWGIYAYTIYSTTQDSFSREAAASTLEQSYIDETQAYLDQWKTNSMLGFIGFGALWAVSGIEALVSINSTSTPIAQAQNTRKDSVHDHFQTSASHRVDPTITWTPIAQLDSRSFGLQIRVNLR